MENTPQKLTLEQLPAFIEAMSEKLDWLVKAFKLHDQKEKNEDNHVLIDIDEASRLIGKAKPTIYGMTSDRTIPFHKKGNKLYFYKDELLQWIESGGQSGVANETDFDYHLAELKSGKRRKPGNTMEK